MSEAAEKVGLRDILQIGLGASTLAFPVAVTEEVWNLSEELSPFRALLILADSVFITSLFVYVHYHRGGRNPSRKDFMSRVLSVYVVTFVICAVLLGVLGRLDVFVDLGVAIKRTILVAFPASFSATVVDTLD